MSPSAAASKPAASVAASAAAKPSAAASASAKPAASAAAAASGKVYKVGISQFFSHPVIDDYTAGFREGMKNAGFVEGQNVQYDIQNGQFSQDNLRAIAQKFSAAKNPWLRSQTIRA